MRIAARRFPQTVTRLRTTGSGFDEVGRPVLGVVTEKNFRANVQPLGVEDMDLVGGAQLSDRRVVYVPVEGALEAAFNDEPADEVRIEGEVFKVENSWTWPGHTRAHVLRET